MDETKGLIYQAIPKVMSEVGAVGKNRRNQQQNYSFRGIDDVTNALNPVMSKHGVFAVPELIESAREERTTKSGGSMFTERSKYKFTFYASDGSSISTITQSEGMDNADKASNKALVAAFKYVVTMLFCIPTEASEDPDGETPESGSKKNGKSATDNNSKEDDKQPAPQRSRRGQPVTEDGEISEPKFDDAAFLRNFQTQRDFEPLPLAEAKAEKTSEGKSYGDLSTEKLYYMMVAISKRISGRNMTAEETPVFIHKLTALQTVLLDRKTNLEAEAA